VQRVRQDPFKEPYIDPPPLAHAELSPELKRLIEEDPDAATVQFVVKASPVNSSAAQLHTLLTLQAQIQEKEKTVLNLEKTLTDLRIAMEERVSSLKDQIQKADGALRERESVIRELQASNEKRIGWLTKYKNAKEKLLPPGSLRARVARKLAGS
jgi:chromosome segregation ATPase